MFICCIVKVIKYIRIVVDHTDSPDWIKNKKAKRNPINKKDNKCFQCTVIVVLNHGEIEKYSERTTRIKSFINQSNWKRINFPSEKDDWKKSEKNNRTIALSVLYTKKEKIYPAYASKHNWNREKQVILLIIPNGE